MKDRIRNLRWTLADLLCRIANKLRGHDDVFLGYDLYGNRAAQLQQNLQGTLFVALQDDAELLAQFTYEVDELANLARATWWHDDKRATRDHQEWMKRRGNE